MSLSSLQDDMSRRAASMAAMANRSNNPQEIQAIQRSLVTGVQNGSIQPYVGIPLIQELTNKLTEAKAQMAQSMAGMQQGPQGQQAPPIAEQVMQQAAQEEIDHLAWCQERLTELGGRSSYLDPLWYLGALCIGATAGLIGDKWSLGFIAETENQVSEHLQNHLGLLPPQDKKSEHILVAMKTDEERHATHAIETGGAPLPALVKFFMRLSAKVMVKTAYYF